MKALLVCLSLALTEISTTNTLSAGAIHRDRLFLNEGRTSIEVYTEGDRQDIGCAFVRSSTNDLLTMEEHSKHCYLVINADFPVYIDVVVQNNEQHPIVYMERASTLLPLK